MAPMRRSMNSPRIELGRGELDSFESAASREWLVTNGLGGFASGTIAGARTRRYHGLLVAALKPPVERVVLVAKLEASARYDGSAFALGSNEYADGTIDPRGFENLASFALEGLTPVWRWVIGDAVLEQRITMVHGENTTVVSFTLVRASSRLALTLKPLCTYRDYHAQARGGWSLGVTPLSGGCEIRAFDGAVPYRIVADRGLFNIRPEWYWNFRHRAETARGLDDREDLFVPGELAVELATGDTVTLTLSTVSSGAEVAHGDRAAPFAREAHRQQKLLEAAPANAPDWIRRLALAADQFIVRRANAGHSVIAGYPWFSDWGRDTMIALPGLTLATGRFDVAASVLRTFARFVSEGMLPNRFPDAGESPEYNTVDATLWYFHALDQYVASSGDRKLVAELYPTLLEIVDAHLRGTRFRIHADSDGLLYAGTPGVQLTWMDSKIGDWVVTPRHGKAVEIQMRDPEVSRQACGHGGLAGPRVAHDHDAMYHRRVTRTPDLGPPRLRLTELLGELRECHGRLARIAVDFAAVNLSAAMIDDAIEEVVSFGVRQILWIARRERSDREASRDVELRTLVDR